MLKIYYYQVDHFASFPSYNLSQKIIYQNNCAPTTRAAANIVNGITIVLPKTQETNKTHITININNHDYY